MRILVVEDERNLNELVVKKLKLEHYSVDACYDGKDAEAISHLPSTIRSCSISCSRDRAGSSCSDGFVRKTIQPRFSC